jgi:hypothetical protein
LHLEYGYGALVEDLRLVDGRTVPFLNMKNFEVATNGDTVTVTITLLDGETVTGTPDTRWGTGATLTGQTDIGDVVLSLGEVRRIEFRW